MAREVWLSSLPYRTVAPARPAAHYGADSTTFATSFTVSVLSGHAAGDLIWLLFVSAGHTSGTAQPTVTDNETGGDTWNQKAFSTDRTLQLWWKRINANGAASGFTITVSGTVTSANGGAVVMENAVASGDPITDVVVEDNISGNETHAAFTPSQANSFVVFGVTNHTNDIDVTSLAAATLGSLEPELFEYESTAGTDCKVIAGGKGQVGAAADTGAFTWAQTNAATRSISFAIKPLASPTLVDQTANITSASTTQVVVNPVTLTGLTVPGTAYLFDKNGSDIWSDPYTVTLQSAGGSILILVSKDMSAPVDMQDMRG